MHGVTKGGEIAQPGSISCKYQANVAINFVLRNGQPRNNVLAKDAGAPRKTLATGVSGDLIVIKQCSNYLQLLCPRTYELPSHVW